MMESRLTAARTGAALVIAGVVLGLTACGSSSSTKSVTKEAGAAGACTPAVMVVRHAEDKANPDGGADILSEVGIAHAKLYPKLFEKYLAKTHGIGGAEVTVCPIGKIIAIDPKANAVNPSPGTNPFNTIDPLAKSLGLTIKTQDAGGVSYSTVYNWNTARRKTLLDGSSTSTVIAWDKQGLNPSADDLNKKINNQTLRSYGYTPLLQTLPTDKTAIIGSSGYFTPQRTDLYVFALQDPTTGKFGFAKRYKQQFSDDNGVTWYYRENLSSTDKPNDVKT